MFEGGAHQDVDETEVISSACEPEVSLSHEDSRQNGEACNLQIVRPERFERTCGGRVGARWRRLTRRPCDGRVLDIL
jgi:hypothetical protein